MVSLSTLKSPGVYVFEVPPLATPIAGAGTSTPGLIGVVPDTVHLVAHPGPNDSADIVNKGFKFVDVSSVPPAASVQFITSWTQFTKLFGGLLGDQNAPANTTAGLAIDQGQRNLAQAVYGFFNNGGTSCYVTRVAPAAAGGDVDLTAALAAFAAIDDIAMVAAPGLTTAADYTALISHCAQLKDRVAILDAPQSDPKVATQPSASDSAAAYFPWIRVSDPGTQLSQAGSDGLIYVPPSGHVAGIWARSDANRGVFKAPANEPVLGAIDVQFRLSDADQDKLNPAGINLIRWRSGAIRVWGARTVGANNGDFKYLSTRRYFNYLRKSIEQGTQWVVFEPNSPSLWKRIIRSIDDFLLNEWHSGALLGDTPKQAYFIKCDADTNPPEVRAAGVVVTEIGVAIVQPAEFVVFEIQKTTGS
jgi:phage tail sheath protein FI